MIHSYCNYGIYNEDTSQCLEEGDSVDRLSYWSDGEMITIEEVQIKDIDKDKITFETDGCKGITIPIEEIKDWD